MEKISVIFYPEVKKRERKDNKKQEVTYWSSFKFSAIHAC